MSISAKTVSLSAAKVYDGNNDLSGAVTLLTGIEGESLSYIDALASAVNVLDGGNFIQTILLEDGALALASNYQLPTLNRDNAAVSISAKTVSLSAAKVYDANSDLSGAVTLLTGIEGESLNYSSAMASGTDVLDSSNFIQTILLEDGALALASNYQLPTLNRDNAAVSISAKTVSLSAAKVYDGNNDLSGAVTLLTGIEGESLSYIDALASAVNVLDGGNFIQTILLEDGALALASNYQLPTLNRDNAAVSISAKTVSLSAAKVYDGNNDLSGAVTLLTGIEGESLSYIDALASAVNVLDGGNFIRSIVLKDGSQGLATNYQLPSLNLTNAAVSIGTKTVSLMATKIYDSTVDLSGVVTLLTGIVGESLNYTGAAANSSHVVAEGNFIEAITLENGAVALASNYSLPALSRETAAVDISALEIGAAAAIVGELDKTYDGTVAVEEVLLVGAISGAAAGDILDLDVSAIELAYLTDNVGLTEIQASGLAGFIIAESTGDSVASDYSFTQPVIANVEGRIKSAFTAPAPATLVMQPEVAVPQIEASVDVATTSPMIADAPETVAPVSAPEVAEVQVQEITVEPVQVAVTVARSVTAGANSSAVVGQGFVAVKVFDAVILDQGMPFEITLGVGTFETVDTETTVSVSATTASGEPLPSWLSFSEGDISFSGTAPEGATQITVQIVAIDANGSEASTELVLDFNDLSTPN